MRQIIFDLDGTLADSALLTTQAFYQVCPLFHIPAPSEEAVKATIGYANPEFYDRLFPHLPVAQVRALGDKVEQAELELLEQIGTNLLFENCQLVLQTLQQANIPLHLASTGDSQHVYGVLNAAGIRDMFASISCDEPDKFEMIAKIIAKHPQDEFIMVGDKPKDSEGARANRIQSVGVLYGYCCPESGGFDTYVQTPLQLLEFLLPSCTLSK